MFFFLLYLVEKLLAPPAADSDGESDGSERVPVPSFQNSFSQAFEKALMQLDSGPVSPPQPAVEPGQAASRRHSPSAPVPFCLHVHSVTGSSFSDDKGGKRKKKKQKLLFSTSMVHTK